MDIIIIGGGVSGLTTGLSLLGVAQQIPELAFLAAPRQTHRVSIWAEKFSPATTSDVAAAIWDPYLVGPEDKVQAWGDVAYRCFQALQSVAGCGVIARNMLKVSTLQPSAAAVPAWTKLVDNYRPATSAELPQGYLSGFFFDSSVIDMTNYYLPFLRQTFVAAGGQLVQQLVSDIDMVLPQADIVINCSGLGSRQLLQDQSIHPIRGQVVRIRANGITQVVVAADAVPNAQPGELAYVVPRIDDIVLGGLAQADDPNDTVNVQQTTGIIERCKQLVPALGNITRSDIISEKVGFRPGRAEVRVERSEVAPNRYLLHNYGHGGAGVTLSWGCAQEIVQLIREIEQ